MEGMSSRGEGSKNELAGTGPREFGRANPRGWRPPAREGDFEKTNWSSLRAWPRGTRLKAACGRGFRRVSRSRVMWMEDTTGDISVGICEKGRNLLGSAPLAV